jgi:hypothetical protein
LWRLNADWNVVWIAAAMVVISLGLGMVMPGLSTASGYAVPFSEVGVVTSAVTFFRTLGGSFGIAAFGAVLKGRFDSLLDDVARRTPLPAGTTAKTLADHPADIHKLDQPLRGLVQGALAHSVGAVFLAAIPVALIVLGIGWFLEELPLRESTTLNAGAGAEDHIPVPAFE